MAKKITRNLSIYSQSKQIFKNKQNK